MNNWCSIVYVPLILLKLLTLIISTLKYLRKCPSTTTSNCNLPSVDYLYEICSPGKDHRIIPIYKSGDKTLVNNYRPISLLYILSKVLERIVYNQVMDHIHSLLTIHQFGIFGQQICRATTSCQYILSRVST